MTEEEIIVRIGRAEKSRAYHEAALARLARGRAEVVVLGKSKRVTKFDRRSASEKRRAEENLPLIDAHLSELRNALAAMRGGRGLRKPAPIPVRAIYTVADAVETAFLCQIAGAPQLACAFVVSETPIAKVRAALLKRADDARSMRPSATLHRAGSGAPTAKPDFWGPIVADMNAGRHRTTNWEAVVLNAEMAGIGS